jgi:hypothetical protein
MASAPNLTQSMATNAEKCVFPVIIRHTIYELKKTPWPESASELYRPSDRRLSAKLMNVNYIVRHIKWMWYCITHYTKLLPLHWYQRTLKYNENTLKNYTLWALSPGVKRLGHDANHSPPTSIDVKKTWIYKSTPPYVFMLKCSIKHTDTSRAKYVHLKIELTDIIYQEPCLIRHLLLYTAVTINELSVHA